MDNRLNELRYEIPFLRHKRYVYVIFLILPFISTIFALFWLYIAATNFIKKKYQPFTLIPYDKNKDNYFYNHVITENGEKYIIEYSNDTQLIKDKLKHLIQIKTYLSFLIFGFFLAWGLRPTGSPVQDIKENVSIIYDELNENITDKQVIKKKVKEVLPVQKVVTVKTKVYSDTTVNYQILKLLNVNDTIVVHKKVGKWYLSVVGSDTGYVNVKFLE
jgi:hypothetical protein